MSVRLEPSSQLSFRRPLTQVTKESLLVTNPNNDPVMFKVKTTAPKQYCVRPNAGRVEANSQVEVQVILQPFKEEPPADFKCRDKFLVQTAVIKPAYESLNVAEMWSRVEAEDKSGIFQQKIKCVFLPPEEDPYLVNEAIQQQPHQNTVDSKPAPAAAAPAPSVPESAKEEKQPEPKTQPELAVTTPAPAPAPAAVSLPSSSEAAVVREEMPELAPKPSKESTRPVNGIDEKAASEPKPRSIPPPAAAAAATPAPAVNEKPLENETIKQLQDELQRARELIEKLQQENAGLQKLQKEADSPVKASRKLSPTVQPQDAVHQHLAALEKPRPTEGYPPQVVLIVASLVFVFTYLFF